MLEPAYHSAVGNTLEKLLGIPENNLPIANANGWELKGQRLHTSSLVTLKHYEPFPRGADIVSKMLLPLYGWPHKVIADSKVEKGREYFSYESLLMLSGFSFDNFLSCIERGIIQIDFDARTHHNHGTKFRIKQGFWKDLYSEVSQLF